MIVNESAENYLETILVLSKKMDAVRSIDIAAELDFKKSSVSVGMKNLREKNYIQVDEFGYITLTAEGRKIAESVLERHTLLSGWLQSIGVDASIASEDACRIEHVISEKSFAAIKDYLKKSSTA